MPRIHFHQQLAGLKDRLLAMAALSQQAFETAVDAFLTRDVAMCQYVAENETAINHAQREVDEMSYELLAQEQPMAIDLRFILAVIKINGNLERIGDQAMSIAERTRQLAKLEPVSSGVDFESMREVARTMIRGALQALLEGDAKLARFVMGLDDQIDRRYREAYAQLMNMISSDPRTTEQALQCIIVSRNLERIADHASNIASDVIFWVDGADLRHEKSRLAPRS